MGTVFRLGAVMAFVFVSAASAAACPVCESETGKRVRAGIFSDRFAADAALILLPFPVLAGLVALIHYGFPNPAAGLPVRDPAATGDPDQA
jgi:uncharacterized paraquat-inducible protein A